MFFILIEHNSHNLSLMQLDSILQSIAHHFGDKEPKAQDAKTKNLNAFDPKLLGLLEQRYKTLLKKELLGLGDPNTLPDAEPPALPALTQKRLENVQMHFECLK